jgi:hypothetical protein
MACPERSFLAKETLKRINEIPHLKNFTVPDETDYPGFQIQVKRWQSWVLFDTISFIIPHECPGRVELMLIKNEEQACIRAIGHDDILRLSLEDLLIEIQHLHDIISDDAEIERLHKIIK